jgi:flagellin-like hook-associated protein FlgL
MSRNITLSAGVRQNLLALQNTASLLSSTQNRLATGKKVNTALDNPTNFFTSSALSARASDLSKILDSMSNGIQTLQAANNGLTAITNAVNSMQATVTQARQDSSWKSASYTIDSATIGTTTGKNLTFSGGSVTGTVNIALNTTGSGSAATAAVVTAANDYTDIDLSHDAGDQLNFDVSDGTTTTSVSLTRAGAGADNSYTIDEAITEIQSQLDAGGTNVTVGKDGAGTKLTFTSNTTGSTSTVTVDNVAIVDGAGSGALQATTDLGISNPTTTGQTASGADAVAPGAVKTVDELVTAINGNASLTGKVKASNDNGKLTIQNLSTEDLTLTGASATAVDGGAGTQTIGGNSVRKNLITQFNDLRSQLDKLADDSSFNGINLLHGDTLKLVFNETNTSSISIVSQDANGINSTVLGIGTASSTEFSDNDALDARADALHNALTQLRSQSSAFGSNLSIVQNRQDFTKNMINTLQVGSDNLTLADSNEEAANLLALQTRQQLSTTALSLASQSDQAVLRLF